MTTDIAVIRAALDAAEQVCRYHGTDFERLGTEPWERGLPRCDSCKQPWRVRRALAALGRLAHGEVPHGIQIGDGNVQSNTYWGRS